MIPRKYQQYQEMIRNGWLMNRSQVIQHKYPDRIRLDNIINTGKYVNKCISPIHAKLKTVASSATEDQWTTHEMLTQYCLLKSTKHKKTPQKTVYVPITWHLSCSDFSLQRRCYEINKWFKEFRATTLRFANLENFRKIKHHQSEQTVTER